MSETNNIYKSWIQSVDRNGHNTHRLRSLDKFSIEELQHLKWLIEEEMRSREARGDKRI